jgi:predicted acyltransferase (DUF342 family)
MKLGFIKANIITLSISVAITMLVVWSGVQSAQLGSLSKDLNNQLLTGNSQPNNYGPFPTDQVINGSIFASEALTIGAGTQIFGNVEAGAAVTTGDSAIISGSSVSVAASTIGANSVISGNIRSGAAVTLGANSEVVGTVEYAAAITNGAGSSTGAQTQNTTPPVLSDEHLVGIETQSALDAMTAGTIITGSNITTDTIFSAGVYDVPGYLTTAADVTLILDAQNHDSVFIFNINTYVSFGAGTVVEVINGTPGTRVIWNVTGGYASIGANSTMIGAILAEQYVVVGADTTIAGSGNSCGGLFSGRSYITIGSNVTIGTNGCTSGIVNDSNTVDPPVVADPQSGNPQNGQAAPLNNL